MDILQRAQILAETHENNLPTTKTENHHETQTDNIVLNLQKNIDQQYEKQKEELEKNTDVQKLAKDIVDRSIKAGFAKDMLEVLTQEHKNELSTHILQIEKAKLNHNIFGDVYLYNNYLSNLETHNSVYQTNFATIEEALEYYKSVHLIQE